jgi:sortase A
MPDKRPVDELSIEELERVLAIRKREARQDRLSRMKNTGRVIESQPQVAPSRVMPPIDQFLGGNPAPAFEEALPAQATSTAYPRRKRGQTSIWRKFMDRSLLLIEVAAVVGLVVIGVVLLSGIQTLQDETAQAQSDAQAAIRAAMPTIEATPTLQLANIVLPGGHTSPLEAGGGQFNFEEIPANLRAQFNDQIFLPPNISRPPVLPETPIRVIISDLNIDEPIVQGVDWDALKSGVGMHLNGATPTDTNANIVLAAHNDIYGQLFRYLDKLEPGMVIQIQTQTRYYEYIITGSDIVDPNDVYVMEPRGYASVTLISCYPYQVNNKRIVVYAEQVNS